MHFFESELNRIMELSGGMGIKGLRIGGRCCYGSLNNGNGVELAFASNGEAGKYEGIFVRIKRFGSTELGKTFIRFGDVWGEKQTRKPNKHGTVPCVKMNGKANYLDWCVYKPNDDDIRLLAARIKEFVSEYAA